MPTVADVLSAPVSDAAVDTIIRVQPLVYPNDLISSVFSAFSSTYLFNQEYDTIATPTTPTPTGILTQANPASSESYIFYLTNGQPDYSTFSTQILAYLNSLASLSQCQSPSAVKSCLLSLFENMGTAGVQSWDVQETSNVYAFGIFGWEAGTVQISGVNKSCRYYMVVMCEASGIAHVFNDVITKTKVLDSTRIPQGVKPTTTFHQDFVEYVNSEPDNESFLEKTAKWREAPGRCVNPAVLKQWMDAQLTAGPGRSAMPVVSSSELIVESETVKAQLVFSWMDDSTKPSKRWFMVLLQEFSTTDSGVDMKVNE